MCNCTPFFSITSYSKGFRKTLCLHTMFEIYINFFLQKKCADFFIHRQINRSNDVTGFRQMLLSCGSMFYHLVWICSSVLSDDFSDAWKVLSLPTVVNSVTCRLAELASEVERHPERRSCEFETKTFFGHMRRLFSTLTGNRCDINMLMFIELFSKALVFSSSSTVYVKLESLRLRT